MNWVFSPPSKGECQDSDICFFCWLIHLLQVPVQLSWGKQTTSAIGGCQQHHLYIFDWKGFFSRKFRMGVTPGDMWHPLSIMPWPSEVKTSSTYEEMNKNIKSKALTQTISNKNGRKQIFIRGFLWKKDRWNDSSFQWLGHLPPISPSISWDVGKPSGFYGF